jgi:hypothetical protein
MYDSLGEQNPVTLADRVDADIVFRVGGVRGERLNDESVEGTGGVLDLLGLAGALLDPGTGLFPALVEAEEAGLSSALDELVGFADELRVEDPLGETGTGLDGGLDRASSGVATCQLCSSCGTRTQSLVRAVEKRQKGDVQLDLGNLDGSDGRFGLAGDGSGRAGQPVRDELLGIVLADS